MKNSEKMLTLIGNTLAIISTIGILVVLVFMFLIPVFENIASPSEVVVGGVIISQKEEINWIMLSISLFSYSITMGFAFMFKVLSNISNKLKAEQ